LLKFRVLTSSRKRRDIPISCRRAELFYRPYGTYSATRDFTHGLTCLRLRSGQALLSYVALWGCGISRAAARYFWAAGQPGAAVPTFASRRLDGRMRPSLPERAWSENGLRTRVGNDIVELGLNNADAVNADVLLPITVRYYTPWCLWEKMREYSQRIFPRQIGRPLRACQAKSFLFPLTHSSKSEFHLASSQTIHRKLLR
jgi:hypothetical protein